MHRDPDGPPLIGNGPGDGLPDPPRRVSGKLEAPIRLKLFRRFHQAQVPLLDQIQERQAPPGVPLGHRDHQPQICLTQASAGFLVPGLRRPGQLCFFVGGKERHPPDLL